MIWSALLLFSAKRMVAAGLGTWLSPPPRLRLATVIVVRAEFVIHVQSVAPRRWLLVRRTVVNPRQQVGPKRCARPQQRRDRPFPRHQPVRERRVLAAREFVRVVIRVEPHRQAKLPQVVQTLRRPRGLLRPAQRRQQQGRQQRNDRYHHQQFDQRERKAASRPARTGSAA